jgi:hypothetical protein
MNCCDAQARAGEGADEHVSRAHLKVRERSSGGGNARLRRISGAA